MEKSDREKIDKSVDELVRKININEFWPKLFEHKIFNTNDVNIPNWERNLHDAETKRSIFLTIKTRGPFAFENLIQSLREINQQDLIEILETSQLSEADKIKYNHRNDNTNDNNISNNNQSDFFRDLRVDFNPARSSEPLKVQVIDSEKYRDIPYGNIEVYPMRSKPRGLVLIITFIEYNNSESYRTAADYDETNLDHLFTQMGFRVIKKRDLSVKEMRETLREFTQDKDLRIVDSCFLIISGHGIRYNGKSYIQCVHHLGITNEESTIISYEDIIDYFTAQNCSHLIRKPKVIVFQACRGEVLQAVVSSRSEDNIYQKYQDDAKHCYDESSRNISDLLIAHSTLPGNISFRDRLTGTWFLQLICYVFMNYAHQYHIQDLFQIVENCLRKLRCVRDGKTCCQTAVIEVIGFKHLYFNPGL